ncbi:hypothetical protein KUCAC02_016768, partial [Chaenocephalus aceratus]
SIIHSVTRDNIRDVYGFLPQILLRSLVNVQSPTCAKEIPSDPVCLCQEEAESTLPSLSLPNPMTPQHVFVTAAKPQWTGASSDENSSPRPRPQKSHTASTRLSLQTNTPASPSFSTNISCSSSAESLLSRSALLLGGKLFVGANVNTLGPDLAPGGHPEKSQNRQEHFHGKS